jgi:hypothetical protein
MLKPGGPVSSQRSHYQLSILRPGLVNQSQEYMFIPKKNYVVLILVYFRTLIIHIGTTARFPVTPFAVYVAPLTYMLELKGDAPNFCLYVWIFVLVATIPRCQFVKQGDRQNFRSNHQYQIISTVYPIYDVIL